MNKVLVLGNDPQINKIDFSKLKPNVITLGVNRIWLKHIPNYFFFSDLIISNELSNYPETLAKLIQNSTVFSSDWIYKGKRNVSPTWTKVYPRKNRSLFPDSVSNAIDLYNTHYHPGSTFYIAGVSLTWQDPSHFWKSKNSEVDSVGKEWYLPRFERISENLKRLKLLDVNLVSVNPDSTLNRFIRYENISNLYKY